MFLPIVRGNSSLLEDLALDFCKRQAHQNIIYTEVRYNPQLLAKNGSFVKLEKGDADLDPNAVVDAITRGLRKGEREYGITVNQILCCIAWRPEWADQIVDLAHERKDAFPCAVVGIDIAAGEEHFDQDNFPHLYKPHFKAFQRAKDLNLNVTMHAGEVANADNITKAVDLYGAKRIGHGYHIAHNQQLMDRMSYENIHFEVCPTSSVETGGWTYDATPNQTKDWRKHPAVIMMNNGIGISFNSDDPAVFNTSLTWQLRIASAKMGLDRDIIWNILLRSVDATFLSEKGKLDLKTRMVSHKTKQEKRKGIRENELLTERVLKQNNPIFLSES